MSDANLVYPLPWQADIWQQLIAMHTEQRLPHALLLTGSSGSGVERLAVAFAQYVLCINPSASGACGNCSGCGLTMAQTHPDFKQLAPEKSGAQIKVDGVREVVAFGQQTAQQGGYRVVNIVPAEAMNTFSANSLLKSLEEPGSKTLFILVSYMPAALLATIKSRCQLLPVAEPDDEQAKNWLSSMVSGDVGVDELLHLTNNQPLTALEYYSSGELEYVQQVNAGLDQLAKSAGNTMKMAGQWVRWPALLVLDTMYYWAAAWIKNQLQQTAVGNNAAVAMQKQLEQIVQRRRNVVAGNNPNMQLLLEALLLDMQRVLRSS